MGKGRFQVSGAGFRGKTKVRSYRDLEVWQRAMDLVVRSYKLTSVLPRNETYGWASQIQRAAISIPANIAEGLGREHLGDYLHHLSIGNGSRMERETPMLVANRLSYLSQEQVDQWLTPTGTLGRMLAGLIRALKTKVT